MWRQLLQLPAIPQAYSVLKGLLCMVKPWACIGRAVNQKEAPFSRETSRHRWWEKYGSWDRISSTSSLCVFLMSLRTLALGLAWAALVPGNRESLFCRIWLVRGAVMDIDMLYWDEGSDVGFSMPTPPSLTGKASRARSVSLNASLPVMAGKKWYLMVSSRGWKKNNQCLTSALDISTCWKAHVWRLSMQHVVGLWHSWRAVWLH